MDRLVGDNTRMNSREPLPCHKVQTMPGHVFRVLLIAQGMLGAACVLVAWCSPSPAGDEGNAKTARTDATDKKDNAARPRLEVMTAHIESIVISSSDPVIQKQTQPAPLFRYDDETRGYVDGTVWRLGETGRPLAIITAELHPNYQGRGASIVYDFLSLTERPFTARSPDIPGWSPHAPAVVLKALPKAPEPLTVASKRLTQLKEQARRFSGTQEIQETEKTTEKTSVHLRLLPREIDRYAPGPQALSDGAIFLFANGRNPALLLVVETDGKDWQYGVGRLSMPSTLEMRLDETVVWSEPRIPIAPGWKEPYTASNNPARFP
jgi:hypothetical protein